MKGRFRAARAGRLCGLWALAQVTSLPRDVRRIIGKLLQWDMAYCWWCLKPYTLSLAIPLVEQLRGVNYAAPRCWRATCGVFACGGTHALEARNPRQPLVEAPARQRGIAYMLTSSYDYSFGNQCKRPERHVKQMLEAFDFLCSLSGDSLPADDFGRNCLQKNAVRLAHERKVRAHKLALAAALREQQVEERLRSEDKRAARQWQREKGRGKRK